MFVLKCHLRKVKVRGGFLKNNCLQKIKKMSIPKINIVLFGPGKIGSLLVSEVLKNQSKYLEIERDIRVSLVVSSSLVFIENKKNKNAWDVSFIKSSKSERITNIVSYIQNNNPENVILIDATNSSELINEYAYFIQSGFNLISLNKNNSTLLQRQIDEIRISSEVYLKRYVELKNTSITKEKASEFALQNILKIAQNVSFYTTAKKAV